MKEKRNLHLKVQEMCDCYATTDPLKEMSLMKNESGVEEAATKWLALAALHGINSNARKITLTQNDHETVSVTAEYQKADLPEPSPQLAESIFHAVRDIAHIEEDKGKRLIALGIRDSSIEIKVKIERDKKGESLTLKFSE